MANNTAAEFLNKVLSDEALKARLADKTPAQAVELAAELGYEVTDEELIAAEKELRRQSSPEVVELDLDDMDKAAGGRRDWAAQGCAATVEEGSWCWGSDFCFLANVTYIHRPTSIKCPSCGGSFDAAKIKELERINAKHERASVSERYRKRHQALSRRFTSAGFNAQS